MQFITQQRQVAQAIGSLASDGTTITGGRVTQTDIQNYINIYYREILFDVLSDKFPLDFRRITYPYDTYTAVGVVDATTTGTSLVTTSSIFTNSMEGYVVQNPTDGATRTLKTYVSGTEFTLDSAVDDDWDGDTIYVLGNVFSFGGDTTDLKEIIEVAVKYASTDSDWTVAQRIDREDAFRIGSETYHKSAPIWSPLSLVEIDGASNEKRRPAIELNPAPDDYQGKLRITYVERPKAMSEDTDEPVLTVQGLSQVLINGAISWALKTEGRHEEAQMWEEGDPKTGAIWPKGTMAMIRSYKPRNRSGAGRIPLSNFYTQMKRYRV
jgi:hypothetical protein